MLSSFVQSLLIAGLCIIVLIAILGARLLWFYVKDLLINPYTEGRIGFWKYSSFGHVFYGRSLGGFRVAYRLSGNIKRVDNEEFKNERMLDKANLSDFAKRFHSDAFLRHLQPRGAWFFVYSWTNLLRESGIITCEPILLLYKAVVDDEDKKLKLEFDANGVDLSRSVISWMNENSWHSHGCCIEVLLINEVMEPSLIEENYSMLTPEQRASAKEHERYLLAEEVAAVAALKRQLYFLEPSGEHQNGDLTIRWSIAGQAVRIEWGISDAARKKGSTVKGFRRADSYSTGNEWSQIENGEMIAFESGSNSAIDHPPAGSNQCYTFMLVRDMKDGSIEKNGLVRFRVRIPEEYGVRSLKKVLEENRTARQKLNKPRNEQTERLMAKIDFDMETRQSLILAKRRRNEQIESRKDISLEEKEILKEELERIFEAAFMRLDY